MPEAEDALSDGSEAASAVSADEPMPGTDEPAPAVDEPTPATEPDSGPAELTDEPGRADALPEVMLDGGFAEGVTGGLTWIPFACYMGLWVVQAGLTAYFLSGATVDQPARWMPVYVPLLWSGVVLTAAGPIMSVVVWAVARARRAPSSRRGLFVSSMIRGALIAFFGMAMWLATLFILEMLATGRVSI